MASVLAVIVVVARVRPVNVTRISALPSTRLGRWSAWLFAAAVAFSVLAAFGLGDASPSVGMLNIGPLIVVVFLLASLVTGVVAMVKARERSWVVWVAVVLPSVVVGAEVISLLIGSD